MLHFDHRIVLGSASPRRRDLLTHIVDDFTVRSADIDESWPAGLPAEEVAPFLAEIKADALFDQLREETVLITADTVVIHAGEVLGKPADAAEATRMLHRLSGDAHDVVTGVSLGTRRSRRSFSVTTQVVFRPLDAAMIEHSVRTDHPLDKAGGYGIQDWIGMVGVERIDGDYFNVVGLPLSAVFDALRPWAVRPT